MYSRKIKRSVFVIVLMFGLCGASAGSAEKMLYRLKFEKGQKYYYKMVVEQKITETMAGREQTVEHTISTGTDMDVNEVDHRGNAWIRYTLRWVATRYKEPMLEVKYDSSDEEAVVPTAAMSLVALIGESYFVRVSPEGFVIQIKGLDKVKDSVLKKFAFAPMQKEVKAEIEQLIGKTALREKIEGDLKIFPKEPVGIGDSWTKVFMAVQGPPMMYENKWTLKSRKDGVATIELATDMQTDKHPMENGYMKVTHNVSGKQDGVIELNESTGMVIRGKINVSMSGISKMESSSSAQGQMMMSVPMRMTGAIIIEATERK